MTLYENEREDNVDPVILALRTRVPSKWRLVDMETGEIWFWHSGFGDWRRANDIVVLPNSDAQAWIEGAEGRVPSRPLPPPTDAT